MFKHFEELIPVIIFLVFSPYYMMKEYSTLAVNLLWLKNTWPFSAAMNVLFMRIQTSYVNLQMNKIFSKPLYEDCRTLWLWKHRVVHTPNEITDVTYVALINKVYWKFISGAQIYVQPIYAFVRLFLGIYHNKIIT